MRAKLNFFIICAIIMLNFNIFNVFANERIVNIDGKKVEDNVTLIDMDKSEAFMNGHDLKYKGKPIIIQNNEIYFPMRDMNKMLRLYNGPDLSWDDKTKTCNIRLSLTENLLSIPMDSNIYYEWGQERYTDKKACLINGSAYIPLSLLQKIFYIPDEGIELDLVDKTLTITRTFNFETNKISIIEEKMDQKTRRFYYRKVDITDRKLIDEFTDALYEGSRYSSHVYAASYTIWLDFNNGTIIGLLPEMDKKYNFEYCSLSNGIDFLPHKPFELSNKAVEILGKVFVNLDIIGF